MCDVGHALLSWRRRRRRRRQQQELVLAVVVAGVGWAGCVLCGAGALHSWRRLEQELVFTGDGQGVRQSPYLGDAGGGCLVGRMCVIRAGPSLVGGAGSSRRLPGRVKVPGRVPPAAAGWCCCSRYSEGWGQ